MRYVVPETESTLESLVGQVLTTRTSAANRAAALEAVHAANPSLDPSRVPAGVVVVVPEVAGLKASAVEEAPGDPVLAAGHAELDALLARAAAGPKRPAKEAKAFAAQVSRWHAQLDGLAALDTPAPPAG